MSGLARTGDIFVGICCSHKKPPCIPMVGALITGSGDCSTSGLSNAFTSSLGLSMCGHIFIVLATSSTTINGLSAARLGDLVIGAGVGTIITSDGNAISNT